MLSPARERVDPRQLYVAVQVFDSFFVAIGYTTAIVYRVTAGRLNPLQLVLLGTVLEASYFVLQLPAGVLADLVSRRLCVIAGSYLVTAGFLMQGLSAHFAVQVAAQVPVGFGAALGFGAQEAWLADEAGSAELTKVFLRATQLGLLAGLAGSILSGVLAAQALRLPFLVAAGLSGLLSVALTCVMPERGFIRPQRAVRPGGVLRQSWPAFTAQAATARQAIRLVPGMVLLLGMMLCLGAWSEGFDRLWGAYLLHDVRLPSPLGLGPAGWFSALAVAGALLGLGSTEWARRRTDRLGPGSAPSTLLALTVGTALGVLLMIATRQFVIVLVCYLAVATIRPVFSPLITGWVTGRVDASVRATALSATDLFDSAGQIAGGPVIGAIGLLASVRAALLASAVALGPATALLAAATRRVRPRPDAAAPGAASPAAGGAAAAEPGTAAS
jgi:DHA3 family tetracycline resistance protein-like MFS transporter